MWIWILVVLVVLVVLVFVIGSFLPEDYAATGRLDCPLPPDELWARLGDYEKHPVTARMCKRIERLPDEDGLPVWIEDMGTSKIRVTTVTSEPPRRLERRMASEGLPMTATLVVEVDPAGDGSRLTVHNHTVIKRGTWHVPVFRFLMSLTGGVKGGIRAYVRQLVGRDAGRLAWE